jgi:hypothetical protein
MFAVLKLNSEVVALYESRANGSEVLLFKRNQGLLGKLRLREQGEAVEDRLLRSFKHICAAQAKKQA